MALLRTRRLGYHEVAVANTIENVYVCPASSRAVVKDVRIVNAFHGASTQTIVGVIPSGGTSSYWLFIGAVASGAIASVTGEVVLEVGDALFVYSDVVGVGVYASGAQLDLPP